MTDTYYRVKELVWSLGGAEDFGGSGKIEVGDVVIEREEEDNDGDVYVQVVPDGASWYVSANALEPAVIVGTDYQVAPGTDGFEDGQVVRVLEDVDRDGDVWVLDDEGGGSYIDVEALLLIPETPVIDLAVELPKTYAEESLKATLFSLNEDLKWKAAQIQAARASIAETEEEVTEIKRKVSEVEEALDRLSPSDTAAAAPEPEVFHFLNKECVPPGVYELFDSKGDRWSSYGGQEIWLRTRDRANAAETTYVGPFTREPK